MRFWTFLILSSALLPSVGLAVPSQMSFQGRILQGNGKPFEYSNVSFLFQILSPDESCVLYQEKLVGYNMIGSGGVFDVAIGSNSIQYLPGFGATQINDTFDNARSYTCGSCTFDGVNHSCSPGTATYVPGINDIRKLKVSFFDGNGWKEISPVNEVRTVPYAAQAQSAAKIGSLAPTDLLTKSLAPVCLSANSFMQWDGTQFVCTPVSFSGTGTVTSISSTNSYLTVSNGTSTASLTLQVGTGPGTVAAGDDPRFSDSRTPSGNAGGDLSGSYPNPTLSLTGVAAGTYTKLDVDAKGRVIAGSNLTATDIPNLDASKISSGTLNVDVSSNTVSSGIGTFQNLRIYDGSSQYLVQLYPTGGAGYQIRWPANQGSAGSVLQNDGSGNLSWVTIPSAPVTSVAGRTGAITLSNTDISGLGTAATRNVAAAGDALAAEIVKGDDTRLSNSRSPSGAAGGDLSGTFPNPEVSRIQGHAVSATAPSAIGQALLWDGSQWHANFVRAQDLRNIWGGTQMIPTASCSTNQAMVWNAIADRFSCQNISNLDASALASGTIATARLGSGTANNSSYLRGDGTWQPFSTIGNFITDLTGDVTASGPGSAIATISNNAVTTAKIADASVTTLKLSNSGVAAGTYPKVTVDIKGRVTAGASLVESDIPNLSATKINSGILPLLHGGTGGNTRQSAINNLLPAQAGENGKVLSSNGTDAVWTALPNAPVSSVAGKTGAVTLTTTDISGLGTSAVLNVPAAGNASATEVVRGNDTRLSDSRTPSGSAGGDLGGTYPNPSVNRIQGRTVSSNAPNVGDILVWNGTAWVPTAQPAGGSGTITGVTAGTGLTGGGTSGSVTLSLSNTTVAAGTYGSATTVPQITVNAQGQVTSASNVAITAGGGASCGGYVHGRIWMTAASGQCAAPYNLYQCVNGSTILVGQVSVPFDCSGN